MAAHDDFFPADLMGPITLIGRDGVSVVIRGSVTRGSVDDDGVISEGLIATIPVQTGTLNDPGQIRWVLMGNNNHEIKSIRRIYEQPDLTPGYLELTLAELTTDGHNE